jgi:hypothetical protein
MKIFHAVWRVLHVLQHLMSETLRFAQLTTRYQAALAADEIRLGGKSVIEHNGGQGRNRTADASLFRAALYQLSYLARIGIATHASFRRSGGTCAV